LEESFWIPVQNWPFSASCHPPARSFPRTPTWEVIKTGINSSGFYPLGGEIPKKSEKPEKEKNI
jgi:hypothetical protein